MAAEANAGGRQSTGELLQVTASALGVGVLSALLLVGLSTIAEALQSFLWDWVPDQTGVADDSPWWTLGVLTLTGLAVGATIQFVPGRAGTDPATVELSAAPLPLWVVPSVALALVLGLAGGVSLGPENPIIAVNVAVAVWLLARFTPGAPAEVGALLAVAGTVGALFGTPVAAALILTGALGATRDVPLFDRLFAPLVAAGVGALTMTLVGTPRFAVDVPPYDSPSWWDLLSAPVVAVAAALLVLVGGRALPVLHRFFHRLPNAVLALGLAGLLLGVLGAIGGRVTLFKGLEEMKQLTTDAPGMPTGELLLVTVIKLAALMVAAAAGFRGGRIFPAVFVGVGIGLTVHAVVPQVPLVVAVAAAVLGTVLMVARDGWLALFMAATTVAEVRILPLLCLVILPLWLVVRSSPELRVAPPRPPVEPGQPGEFGTRSRAHA